MKMRALFLILVAIHGAIHFLGFIKAFGLREIPQLSLPIARPVGLMWLLTVGLFMTYGLFVLLHARTAWIAGFMAVALSQLLIFSSWKDASFGTLPNLIMLVVALFQFGEFRFQSISEKAREQILAYSGPGQVEVPLESGYDGLPAPVQKWLRHCCPDDLQKIRNGRITQLARMKMKMGQQDWYTAKAIQYTVVPVPAFIWTVDLNLNRLLWFKGRDLFLEGKGEMLICLNSLVPVVRARGPKTDEATLQRYLGEMVWFPSLALSPHVQWEPIDAKSARATMSYQGTRGSGTFYFNDSGDFIKFIALRYQSNDSAAQRKEWVLDVEDYRVFEGVRVPSRIRATWKLDSGDWTWLEMEVADIDYNVDFKRGEDNVQ